MTDPATCVGAACVAKKGLLALPFLGAAIGMTVAKTGTLSIDVIKNWSVVAAALATAFYVGTIVTAFDKQNEIAELQHASIRLHTDSEILELKQQVETEMVDLRYKANFAYERANLGNRYTFDMAQSDKKEIKTSIDENSNEDNIRHATLADAIVAISQRMTRLFEKIDVLNKKTGVN